MLLLLRLRLLLLLMLQTFVHRLQTMFLLLHTVFPVPHPKPALLRAPPNVYCSVKTVVKFLQPGTPHISLPSAPPVYYREH